jgi:hypothetical protein
MKTITSYQHTASALQCECESHPEGANFYVSIVDGPRFNVLAGPYETHAEALRHVPAVSGWAERVNPRVAAFASFGTVAMEHSFTRPGLANQHMNVYA